MGSGINIRGSVSRNRLLQTSGIRSEVVHSPGVGGMVTDAPSWMLKTTPYCQSPNMQDIIFPNGIAACRGAGTRVTISGTYSTLFAGNMYVESTPGSRGSYNIFYSKKGGGTLQWAYGWNTFSTTGTGQVAAGPVISYEFVPWCRWGDEIIWGSPANSQSGNPAQPFLRTVIGPTGSTSSSVGTLSYTANSQNVTDSSSNLPTSASTGTGQYVGWGFANATGAPLSARLKAASSGTAGSIDFPSPVTVSGFSDASQNYGVLGLSVTVCDNGTVTSSSGTLTGVGTNWQGSGANYTAPAVGDIITVPGPNTSNWAIVTSVSSNTSLTYSGTLSLTGSNYVIRRPMCGSHACIYNGRLVIVGVPWQRRRIYYSPLTSSTEIYASPQTQGPVQPWTLGDPTNGYYSPTQNIGDVNEMPWFDVPDKNTSGSIIATAPTASGLLILATDGAYMAHGDLATNNQRLLSPGSDCIDPRSVVNAHNATYWVGANGIFCFAGGRVSDLAEHGGRSAEWQEIVEAAYLGLTNVNCYPIFWTWVVSNHFVVNAFYYDNTVGTTVQKNWVYDLHRQVWCGNHTTTYTTNGFYSGAASVTDQNEAFLFVSPHTLGPNFTPTTPQLLMAHEIYEDEGESDPLATPIIDLPLSVCGLDIGEQRRVVEVKMSYASSDQMQIYSGMDGNPIGLDYTLPISTGNNSNIIPFYDSNNGNSVWVGTNCTVPSFAPVAGGSAFILTISGTPASASVVGNQYYSVTAGIPWCAFFTFGNVSSPQVINVTPVVNWYTSSYSLISTSTGSATSVPITSTFNNALAGYYTNVPLTNITAPNNAVYATVGFSVTAASGNLSSSYNIQFNQAALVQGSNITSWSYTPQIQTNRFTPAMCQSTGALGTLGNAYNMRITGKSYGAVWRPHMITLQVRNWPGRVA